MSDATIPIHAIHAIKGRGTAMPRPHRLEKYTRSAIKRNDSPVDHPVNPICGCDYGCVCCFARLG